MARGNLYELRKNAEETGYITDDMFYDYDGFEFDYTVTLNEEESKREVNAFLDIVKGFGAQIGTENVNGKEMHYVIFSNEMKEAYFAKRFEELKNLVNAMDLHEFATSEPNQMKRLIDDDYEDAVYTGGGGLYTMDYFIREAETDVKYYVGMNVLYMH